jgi:trans-2,3-dihydro-3-hydroxyanthranilate isomerase
MIRPIPYVLCDVFTDRALAGNALAVFVEADDLDGATMQALARETNLSESAFVLPPTSPGTDARVRIFTPTMELPFAGHPTLGTAFVLAARRQRDVVTLETARGIVTVRLRQGGFGWMTQPHPHIHPYDHVEELLAALGVPGSTLPVELYDNGPHYVYVERETPEQIAALRPEVSRLAALGSTAFCAFARKGGATARIWKSRVFAPGEGIVEDPATGAAAGPLALHLSRHGRIAFGDEIVIEQGVEIGRPSTLHARVVGSANRLEAVEVGGHTVIVGEGAFRLPPD